jgi:hypothetical protein
VLAHHFPALFSRVFSNCPCRCALSTLRSTSPKSRNTSSWPHNLFRRPLQSQCGVTQQPSVFWRLLCAIRLSGTLPRRLRHRLRMSRRGSPAAPPSWPAAPYHPQLMTVMCPPPMMQVLCSPNFSPLVFLGAKAAVCLMRSAAEGGNEDDTTKSRRKSVAACVVRASTSHERHIFSGTITAMRLRKAGTAKARTRYAHARLSACCSLMKT